MFIDDYIKNQGKIINSEKIKIIESKCGWGVPLFNSDPDNKLSLRINDKIFKTGMFCHADSYVLFDVLENMDRLTTYVGINTRLNVPVVFTNKFIYKIYGDNNLLWESPEVVRGDEALFVDLNISGIKKLKLETKAIDSSVMGHTIWGELTFYSGEDKVVIGESENSNFFSFKYNGLDSKDFLSSWNRDFSITNLGDVTRYTTVYTDPETKLQAITEIHKYAGFDNYWWNLKFKNAGDKNSYKISDVKSIDFNLGTSMNVKLTSAIGSLFLVNDFEHKTEIIKDTINLKTNGGRSSQAQFPYFRIEDGNSGVLCAIGWSGQWYANIKKNDVGINIEAGVETFSSVLYPNESIKMCSICIMPYEGDIQKAHNKWRKFMYKHNTPKIQGKDIKVPICYTSWGGLFEQQHYDRIEMIKREKLDYDYYWIDAAWYGDEEGHCITAWEPGWGEQAGNWYVNPKAYPNGMEPVSKAIHDAGMKFLLWFEMQRARENTQIVREHKEWFIGKKEGEKPIGEVAQLDSLGIDLLFNIGMDEACDWLIDFVSGLIQKWNIDCFREDFNINPLPYWQYEDTRDSDRVGITEVKCVNNYWKFWDGLLERNPNLFIDNCASGGRRLDIEMVGRGIALWRSDYQCYDNFDPMGPQHQFMNLMPWIPVHTGGSDYPCKQDTFVHRSCMSTGSAFWLMGEDRFDLNAYTGFDWNRKMMSDYRRCEEYFYGDYYKLIFGGVNPELWNAYQMHREDLNAGIVMAFRQVDSPYSTFSTKLNALSEDKQYQIEDIDTGEKTIIKGSEEFVIDIPNKRCAKLYLYNEI